MTAFQQGDRVKSQGIPHLAPKTATISRCCSTRRRTGFATCSSSRSSRPGGATPPNTHLDADEFFYVLHGEGVARCGAVETPIKTGDALLIKPGNEHVIRNTGSTKLYCLTVMTPDEGFAELIRGGEPVELDEEDLRVLAA